MSNVSEFNFNTAIIRGCNDDDVVFTLSSYSDSVTRQVPKEIVFLSDETIAKIMLHNYLMECVRHTNLAIRILVFQCHVFLCNFR